MDAKFMFYLCFFFLELIMIMSFKNKALEDFFYDGNPKKIQADHIKKLERILDFLDAAACPKDMNYPGSGFHALQGELKGSYAVKVNGNWRVTFKFMDNHAYEVDYLDYH